MKFTAYVKNKETKEKLFITREYSSKADFLFDLKANGYSVNPSKVKEANLFDWIISNTNADDTDWKLTSIPANMEDYRDIREYIIFGKHL